MGIYFGIETGDCAPLRRAIAALLLLGICATTAFVSMWIHNTPTAVMMMPVATGILQRLPSGTSAHPDVTRFSKALVLGVIYSAAVGGISTLTGTGVNLILVAMWQSYFPEAKPVSFSIWSFFPLAVVNFVALWIILCLHYCSKTSAQSLAAYLDRTRLKRELDLLEHLTSFYLWLQRPMASAEKMIVRIFLVLVILWMTRDLSDEVRGWGALFYGLARDGTVSVMMATFLFIIPKRKGGHREKEKLMDWNKCKKLPWGIVLLLGGAGADFAIAEGVRTSSLADVLSTFLYFLKTAPYLALSPAVCLIGSIITELTSNNSTTTLLLPLLIEFAHCMHLESPLLLMVPGAIGAQFAFLLPTGTPSNIVGFTTGHLTPGDVIRTGFPQKIAGIAALSLLMPTLGTSTFLGISRHHKDQLNKTYTDKHRIREAKVMCFLLIMDIYMVLFKD